MPDPIKHTERSIQEALGKHFWKKGHKFLISNFMGNGFGETDFLSVTNSDYIYAYEIKISKYDFKNDFKHKQYKHRRLKTVTKKQKQPGLPNYFYFVVPTKLVDLRSIPEYSGLLYVNEQQEVEVIKRAKILHKNKCDLKFYKRILQTYVERELFGKSYYSHCVEQRKLARIVAKAAKKLKN